MRNEVCLFVIYNHRYDANIEKIEKIYQSRFHNIYHIMPFYDGKKKNVITIYECSFRFEGYIAQAMKLLEESYEQYFFVADDIILNPEINELNYKEWFELKEKEAFITFLKPIREMKGWAISRRFMDPLPKLEWYNGTFWKNEIIPTEEAFIIAKEKGYSREDFCVSLSAVWDARKKMLKYPRLIVLFFKILILGRQYCPYPLWGGYSDIFIVPGKDMQAAAHMMGVFAAMDVFVEMAIPTTLNLLCRKVVQEKDLKVKSRVLWSNEDRNSIEEKYHCNYQELIESWQEDCLYIHPVKLSKWEV